MVWCKGQFIACKSAFVETSHSDKRFHIIFNMNKLIFIAIFLKKCARLCINISFKDFSANQQSAH